LRKDPSRRIDAEEAERLLRQAATQLPSPATAAAPASTTLAEETTSTPAPATTATAARKRRRWLIAAVAAVIVAAAVVAGRVSNVPTDHAAVPTTSMPPDPAPTGWYYSTQDSDFSVPIPDGWQQLHEGQHVEFHEPGGARMLAIDKLGAPKADLLADARAAETADRETGRYPHYEPIDISAVTYQVRAVDREWTYADAGGMRMHTVSRTFVAENGQYTIDWTTPDTAWTASKAALLRILAGFHAQQVQASSGVASPSARPSRSVRPPASAKSTSPPAQPLFTDRPIINLGSGKCIDIPGNSADTLAEIQMWDCLNIAGQRFTFTRDNTLRILGKCLEIRGINNGTNLRIATCTGAPARRGSDST
jgi:eukaryotic-like serine/threonine-protein kinase